MKYGVNSLLWSSPFSESDIEKIKYAKEVGFEIFEIAVDDIECVDALYLREYANDNGIDIYISGVFNKYRDLSSDNENINNNALSYIKKLIDIASVVGSPYVSGPMYSATGHTRLLNQDEKRQRDVRVIKSMKKLAVYAKSKDVKLAIEPLNRFETDYINTVEQAINLLNGIEEDNVGLLLDTFHMNIEERSISGAINLAGDKLFSIHASSNDRGTPGKDNIDWQEIKESLNSINYNGPMIIEAFTKDVSELLEAARLWRDVYKTRDDLMRDGLNFLSDTFN